MLGRKRKLDDFTAETYFGPGYTLEVVISDGLWKNGAPSSFISELDTV